uniref:Uncharacterized protein n=1 Tax=Anopheles culicifacies TaxID=139723 RepID=A0A182MAJ2_9DIPT
MVDPVIEETRIVKPGKKANVSVHTVFYDSDGSDGSDGSDDSGGSGQFRRFRKDPSVLDGSGRFQTVPDDSGRFRTIPDASTWNLRFLFLGIGTGITPVGTG